MGEKGVTCTPAGLRVGVEGDPATRKGEVAEQERVAPLELAAQSLEVGSTPRRALAEKPPFP